MLVLLAFATFSYKKNQPGNENWPPENYKLLMEFSEILRFLAAKQKWSIKVPWFSFLLCVWNYVQQNTEAARQFFVETIRTSTKLSHHVYVSGALCEYFVNKEKEAAKKIFSVAWEKFSDVPEFVLSYIEFLLMLNDTQSYRNCKL